MITVAEHTFDETLLNYWLILDAGSGENEFGNYFLPGASTPESAIVYCVDIEPGDSLRYAIAGYNGRAGVIRSEDKQANKIGPGNEVECVTIEEFSRRCGVDFWDIIKLDIEGSEIGAILAMTRPMAKQITVEFHLHCGQTEQEVSQAVGWLLFLGYKTIQHELTDRHCAGLNYWDSLFILK